MKKGPLSKKDKAYITANYLDATSDIMADYIDRSVHVVNKFVSTLSFHQQEEKIETESSAPQDVATSKEKVERLGTASVLFARNKKQGVTVMTEAASTKGDEARDLNRSNPKRQKGMIHIIKKD